MKEARRCTVCGFEWESALGACGCQPVFCCQPATLRRKAHQNRKRRK